MFCGGLASTFGLGFFDQSSACGQPLLQLADAGEVLVELLAVAHCRGRVAASSPGRATVSRMLRPR